MALKRVVQAMVIRLKSSTGVARALIYPRARSGSRLRRVPDECPQAAVDLHLRCISSEPEARPTAAEIIHLISRLPRSSSGRLRSFMALSGREAA